MPTYTVTLWHGAVPSRTQVQAKDICYARLIASVMAGQDKADMVSVKETQPAPLTSSTGESRT